jgi:GT2 family glycosyltransferase
LAFTDDDCAPSPGWLRVFAGDLATAPDAVVGGHTVKALADNDSAASQMLIDYLYSYFNAKGDASFFASNNICVPADRCRMVAGFDASFATAEDHEFCDRWLHRGYRIISAPAAIVYHAHSLTLLTFCRQRWNYGRGAPRFSRVRDRRDVRARAVNLVTFYFNLLRHPYLHAAGGRAIRTRHTAPGDLRSQTVRR